MAGQLVNETSLNDSEIQSAPHFNYALIVSQWHPSITDKLRDGALYLLSQCKVSIEHINIISVPGAFELPLAAKWLIEHSHTDAIICLGCIIKGETKHDEIIAKSVSDAIIHLNIQSEMPILFGVLTVDNVQQAEDRAGGALGNKGSEAAVAAIKMLYLQSQLKT